MTLHLSCAQLGAKLLMTNKCNAGSLSYLFVCEKSTGGLGRQLRIKRLAHKCGNQSLDIQNQVKADGHNGQPVIPALERQSSWRKQAAKISQ